MDDSSATLHRGPLRSFVEERIPNSARDVEVHVRALRGGLSSKSVNEVSIRYRCGSGRVRCVRFVVKRLDGIAAREARIYECLLSTRAHGLAPELYGVHYRELGPSHLCIEAISAQRRWPWKDLDLAQGVLERISRLHALGVVEPSADLCDWDYDAELAESAHRTVAAVENARAFLRSPQLRRSLPALRRLARRLPSIREALRATSLLRHSIIHGDLHPGNVVIRRVRRSSEPVFIDWARARLGSPLEDVASWLQWLGFWEPEVRRKHDTLLGAYLRARGLPPVPCRSVRQAYWLAGASNCYAGVMIYHLSVAAETAHDNPRHRVAISAVHDCLRVIRRADAYILPTRGPLQDAGRTARISAGTSIAVGPTRPNPAGYRSTQRSVADAPSPDV